MCSLFVTAFIIFFAIMAYVLGAAFLGVIVIVIGLLVSMSNYKKAKQEKPTPMPLICPDCQSQNVEIVREVSGLTGGSVSSHGVTSSGHKVNRHRVCVCKNCGYDYPYVSEADVAKKIADAKGTRDFWLFLAIVAASIGGWLYYKAQTNEPEDYTTVQMDYGEDSESVENASSIPIDDFNYTISGNTVSLRSYKGDGPIARIMTAYQIDGTEYQTDISEFQVSGYNAKTLIIDEGFTEVYTSIFNSCDVEKVFFPKSMIYVYDYTLSYLHPREGEKIQIYYAGTEDEWNDIFIAYQRTKVEDAEFGEELGSALADKVNELIGMDYDSTLFEYHFSAKPEDVI